MSSTIARQIGQGLDVIVVATSDGVLQIEFEVGVLRGPLQDSIAGINVLCQQNAHVPGQHIR